MHQLLQTKFLHTKSLSGQNEAILSWDLFGILPKMLSQIMYWCIKLFISRICHMDTQTQTHVWYTFSHNHPCTHKHTMYLALLAGSRSLTSISPFSSQGYSSSSPSLSPSLHSASSFLPSGFSLQGDRRDLVDLFNFNLIYLESVTEPGELLTFRWNLSENVRLETYNAKKKEKDPY